MIDNSPASRFPHPQLPGVLLLILFLPGFLSSQTVETKPDSTKPKLEVHVGYTGEISGKFSLEFAGEFTDRSLLIFILDGKEVTGEEADQMMKTLDPEEVDSITLIRGRDAVADYGPAGKHGVIKITLKSSVPGQPDDAILIQQAGLRWLLEGADQHPLGALKTACFVEPNLEEEQEADTTVLGMDRGSLTEFMSLAFGLRTEPRARCENRQVGGRNSGAYLDTETGEPAVLLLLRNPKILESTKAEIRLGFVIGQDWGEDFRCDVERGDEGWVVGHCERTGIW